MKNNRFGITLARGDRLVCERCEGAGVDPAPNDPTNQCGNAFKQGDGKLIDTGIPICRSCGGYGTVPRAAA